jgi:hypothetical protein
VFSFPERMVSDRVGPQVRTAEAELLLHCCRVPVDESRVEHLRSLAEGVDWDRLIELARRHGTVTLLSHALSTTVPEHVPDTVLTPLRVRYHEVARRNLYQVVELLGILEDLDRDGVAAIPFKGPVLAETAYGNLGLREFTDLDVLVRPRDTERAIEILRGRGYEPWTDPSTTRARIARETQYALPLSRLQDRMTVDLHWAFARKFFAADVDEDLVWSNARAGRMQQRDVLLLPPPLMPIALAVHGSKHGPFPWPRLKWVADMGALVHALPAAEWTEALDLSRRMGVRRMLLLGVALSQRLLGATPEGELAEAVASDPKAIRLASQVESWLLAEPIPTLSFSQRSRFDLSARERWRERFRYGFRRLVLPTSQDVDAVPLPQGLRFLYWPLRWIRLAWGYLRSPGRWSKLRTPPPPDSDSTGSSDRRV